MREVDGGALPSKGKSTLFVLIRTGSQTICPQGSERQWKWLKGTRKRSGGNHGHGRACYVSLYSSARPVITKRPRLGGLSNRNYFPLVLGARIPRSRRGQVQFLLPPLFLPCRWLSVAGCSHVLSSVSPCVLISSYRDTSHIGLGPTIVISFYNHLFKEANFHI